MRRYWWNVSISPGTCLQPVSTVQVLLETCGQTGRSARCWLHRLRFPVPGSRFQPWPSSMRGRLLRQVVLVGSKTKIEREEPPRPVVKMDNWSGPSRHLLSWAKFRLWQGSQRTACPNNNGMHCSSCWVFFSVHRVLAFARSINTLLHVAH